MAGKYIDYFMWGYQESYRKSIQSLIRKVLKALNVPEDAEVLVVGARNPDSDNPNQICVEPEYSKWQLSLFDGLLEAIEFNYKDHEMQSMFYGDEASMRDKPEWIRRDSVRKAVKKALEVYDVENSVTSFCGEARRLNDYYITPVIQIPNTTFKQFPPLPQINEQQKSGFRSLIHSAIYAVLKEATAELHNPDPGRNSFQSIRNEEEIVRIAAKNFMYTPGAAIEKRYMHNDLFSSLNIISSLMYEKTKGIGHLILVDPDNEAVEFLVRFDEPITFRESRWIRKVLQMATTGIGIIANSQYIYGLGKLKESHDPSTQDSFTVEFLDHYHWELRCGSQALLRSYYAEPSLPQAPFDKMAFLANYKRLFPLSTTNDGMNMWDLMLVQIKQEHGSMIVVTEDAVNEARRLSKQGTRIKPTKLTTPMLKSVSCIDGTILLDPAGDCHAIGIILDGGATELCTPSRGSRFNSGVRYVYSANARRLAIVVSDDRTIDVIPPIRKLVSREKIEKYIATFEAAKLDNFHDSRNWLDDHRFYINAEQCTRINKALDRIDALPKECGLIYFSTKRFEVHPEMDESYLID